MAKAGDRVTGIYNRRAFDGTLRVIEPNWEQGSRGAVNLYVDVPGFEPARGTMPARDSIAILAVNLETGRQYRGCGIYENVKVWE